MGGLARNTVSTLAFSAIFGNEKHRRPVFYDGLERPLIECAQNLSQVMTQFQMINFENYYNQFFPVLDDLKAASA